MTAQWTAPQVAEHWGVTPATVRAYAARGQMPPPDGRIGRSDWWLPATIQAWPRPGRGNRRDQASFDLPPTHPDEARQLQHHLTALGLCLILGQQVGELTVNCNEATGSYTLGRTPEEVARAVRDHAAAQCHVPWDTPQPGPTLLGPRLRPVGRLTAKAQWARRQKLLAGLDDLTRGLVAGLGFPASLLSADFHAAAGRSWWDVTDRRRGDELGPTRIAPLAQHVAGLSEARILNGLANPIEDPAAFSPRWTSMRWQHGHSDPVRVWCSIWALAAFPVTPAVGTSGGAPAIHWVAPGVGTSGGQQFLALPIPLGSVVAGHAWADMAGQPAITRAAANMHHWKGLSDLLWVHHQGFAVARWDVRAVPGSKVIDRYVDDPCDVAQPDHIGRPRKADG